MDIDLSRMPTGATGWCELVNHAQSLGDLSEVDWLELKGTLLFGSRADRKRSAVVLARAVLGMANRMPDVAARHLAGHGVVLVGIDGNSVSGAEEVDGAHLHDALDPYVGQDGLGWDYTFIKHPDGLVMALTVNPPKWGDSMFTFQKEFSDDDISIRDGEIFVRVPGKTRPATSQDSRDLQRRLRASPSSGAEVAVEYVGTFDRIDSKSAIDLVRSMVDRAADGLLDSALAPPPSTPMTRIAGLQFPTSMLMEEVQKSRGAFRAGIEEWRSDALAKSEYVATEFLRYELARGRLRIGNRSDRYLEGVRVQMQFPPGISVLIGSDTEYCDHGGLFNPFSLLPDRPPNWENFHPYLGDLSALRFQAPRLAAPSLGSQFDVEDSKEGALLTWDVGDLRPKDSEQSDETFAVFKDEHGGDVLPVRWRVTARGVDHVFSGDVRIACSQEPTEHLYWKSKDADTGDDAHEH